MNAEFKIRERLDCFIANDPTPESSGAAVRLADFTLTTSSSNPHETENVNRRTGNSISC